MSRSRDRRGKSRAKARISRTYRAGLKFPVGRIHRFLRKRNYAKRFSANAPVFLAAVMEFMTREVMFLAGYEARSWKSRRITPRHLQLAMHVDVELDELVKNVIIPQGGAVCCSPIKEVYPCFIQILPPADF
ncbi:histone H2A-beta, sperm-like [Bufo bufo]|uniref:histone H2A-beta, sperm-like n=1 Tax=Bufo bufo TaxID=8384 RepID=UPI001ABED986|nr:histone H2A-beta, sperm-like [Bufo bufo]